MGQANDASVFVVLTSCSEVPVHRTRVQGRSRLIPGWHELTWDNVNHFLDTWVAPSNVDLHLDAANSLQGNLAQLLAALVPWTSRRP